jgi:hypothetical protein
MTRSRFFLYMSSMFFAIVLVGFSRSLYLRTYFAFPELPVYLYLHGIALTAWFTLAFIQPWLIKVRRADLHRRLGVFGMALAVSVVMTGLWTLAFRDAVDIDEFPSAAAPNLASLMMFSACVALGVWFRLKSATHKRLMLIASIPLLSPALDRVARIPALNEFWGRLLYWFPAPTEVAFAAMSFLALLLTVVVYDLVSERRVQSGTYWGLFAIFVIAPAATFLFISSGAWVMFVHWAVEV